MFRLLRLLVVPLALVGCSRNLELPEPPTPTSEPTVLNFEPKAAYAGDRIVVYGQNFDAVGNQVIFEGSSVFAESIDGGDEYIDGGLGGSVRGIYVKVPEDLNFAVPLVVLNTNGRSNPSDTVFTPLGTGYPNKGAPVSSIRFRHDPIGIIDRFENVLMASSLFELLLTDGKAFSAVPGKPLSMVPVTGDRDAGFVSIETENGSRVLVVSADDGTVLQTSEERSIRDEVVLPGIPPSVGRSIGADRMGKYWLSDWRVASNGRLTATTREMPFVELLGANAWGPDVVVVGRGPDTGIGPGVYHVPLTSNARLVFPLNAMTRCMSDPEAVECTPADGPVTVVPKGDGGIDFVASLESGDLAVIDGQNQDARELTLISYAKIDDLETGIGTDHVVLSKSRDGALFQFDLTTDELDWAVQVRGEPTVISVAPDIDEIAVANRTENSVDTVVASTGQWSGRIAFDLGLGAEAGHAGGVVATYSYDPDRNPADFTYPNETMDLLMRNIGLVLTFDASSLELGRLSILQPPDVAGAPVRLLAAQQSQRGPFETLVLHRKGIGLLEEVDGGMRTERIVTTTTFDWVATDALVMSDGSIVLSSSDAVRSYTWSGTGTSRTLGLAGIFSVPNGSTVAGIAVTGPNVLVVEFSGQRIEVTERRVRGLDIVDSWSITPGGRDTYSQFVKAVTLREGAALLFGDAQITVDGMPQRGPAIWFPSDVLTSAPSVITGKRVTGVSPNGRFIVWAETDAPEPMIRLTEAAPNGAVSLFSAYRLPSPPAGGDFEPSGQWLYLPLPGTDQLDVVQ